MTHVVQTRIVTRLGRADTYWADSRAPMSRFADAMMSTLASVMILVLQPLSASRPAWAAGHPAHPGKRHAGRPWQRRARAGRSRECGIWWWLGDRQEPTSFNAWSSNQILPLPVSPRSVRFPLFSLRPRPTPVPPTTTNTYWVCAHTPRVWEL
jgi:hypothetical protein